MRIYLRNHDVHKRVLAYHPDTGEYQELAREELEPGQKERTGFYVNADCDVVGVYSSPDGPIFFFDADRYRLSDPACKVDVTTDDKSGELRLHWSGQPRVHVRYERTPYKDFDSWSADEEMVDFYLWLKRALGRPTFFKNYSESW